MACGATLKRSLEFDPLHSPGRSPKRLCLPKDLMSPTSHTKQHMQTIACGSGVSEATQKYINSHCASRVGFSSPPHSPASRDVNQQTITSSNIATSTSDLSSPVLKSPTNLSVRQSTLLSVKEQPLFTLTQVDMICRRVVQEHEEHVREQFDRVLNHKLSEQYESFLKFNHDQLKRRFESQMTDCSLGSYEI